MRNVAEAGRTASAGIESWIETLATSAERLAVREDGLWSLRSASLVTDARAREPTHELSTEEVVQRLGELVQARGVGAAECEAIDEPHQIAEIAGSLLRPYRIENGSVRLAGCAWDSRPVLGLMWTGHYADHPTAADEESSAAVHLAWFDPSGQPLAPRDVVDAGLDHLVPVRGRLRSEDRQTISQWVQAVQGPASRAAVFVAWRRWASGKIAISIDQQTAYLPYAGWGRDLAAGRQPPPKYQCAASGLESYEVVRLDDGTWSVPEAVAICEDTGQRVLRSSLVTCAVSGGLITTDASVLSECSGLPMRPTLAARCDWCLRCVAPSELKDGRCVDCAELAPITTLQDAALQYLFTTEPHLAAYRHWRGADMGALSVRVGRSIWREVLRVVDLQHRRTLRSGERKRGWGNWKITES